MSNLSESLELYQKARCLMDENQFEEAIDVFEQSATLNPHFKTLELLGECYFHTNRLEEAVVPLTAAVNLNKSVRAASLLAEVFLKLKDFDKAKEMADIALNRDANNKIALSVMKTISATI